MNESCLKIRKMRTNPRALIYISSLGAFSRKAGTLSGENKVSQIVSAQSGTLRYSPSNLTVLGFYTCIPATNDIHIIEWVRVDCHTGHQ